jgi:hypothetical protein
MKDDLLIAQPNNPGTPNTPITWIDTGDGTYRDFEGFIGEVLFDQDVTVLIRTSAQGRPDADLATMNNGGDGDVVPANTPTVIRVGFLGARTQIQLQTGDDAPTVFHANGRVTRGELGGPADNTVTWGVQANAPGPKGADGADGADGTDGTDGADGAGFAQNGATLTAAATLNLPDGKDTFIVTGAATIATFGNGARAAGAEITFYLLPAGVITFNSVGGNIRLGDASSQLSTLTNNIGGDVRGALFRFKLVNIPVIGLKWVNTAGPIVLDDNS